MSKQKTGKGDGGLPLPSPTSPPALDDKVLGYARDRASSNAKEKTPARTGLLGHPWATGLVTASVVAIALFISEPQQPSPTLQRMPIGADNTLDKPAAPARGWMAEDLSAEMDVTTDMPKAKTAKSEILQPQETMAGAPAEQALIHSAEPQEREDTAATLTRCAQLLREERTDEAEALYRQLRERCRECQLPETLQAALENYPEDY